MLDVKSNATYTLRVAHKDGRACSNGDEPDGWVTFKIRELVGRDTIALGDHMQETDRRGAQRFLAGSVTRDTICRAVVSVDGLSIDGQAVDKINANNFDRIPRWIIDALGVHIGSRETGEVVTEIERDFEKPSTT